MAGAAVVQISICVSDEMLASAAAGGNRQAFDALVDRYRDLAFAYAFARLNSREEAEDVVQEAFVRALVALNRFRADGSWGAWLMRIVRNRCHDCLRRRRVRVSIALDDTWLDSRICSAASTSVPVSVERRSTSFRSSHPRWLPRSP